MSAPIIPSRLALVCASTLLVGCGGQEELTEMLGGSAGRAAIADPASVEAIRLEPANPLPDPDDIDLEALERLVLPDSLPEGISDYREVAGPVAVPAAQAAALDSPGWLSPDVAKACEPLYGLRVRFTGRNGTVVDIWNCFECDILSVVIDGEVVGGDDSDDLRPILLAVARQAFPDDEALASLEE
ncbi:hypothetical protein [Alienimonas chondri]|nr:hypothetical protein [Alienimonas chondri]